MAGRASIVGAAATHVGKVREHNEDAHFFDADAGLFVVCDGMGGHAAGEVASGVAIRTIRQRWTSELVQTAIDHWLEQGTPDAKKQLLAAVRGGVIAAHDAILKEAASDDAKAGMGTTLVGAVTVGNELVFAHAGDSRAYIVRDGIAMQLTEDHTLLSRLLAAGIDVDLSGEGARFRSMLTNALGIGQECKVSTFVVPLADGDRFLLCSDGISEYVPEPEVGKVLTTQPSPARAAQKLIELALERGGGDNATAVVIRVLEAGETPQPVELRRKDDAAIQACPLWERLSPQQRLRALRIALARDLGVDERLPAHTLGDRVAWIIIEGQLERDGQELGPGSFVYPESLVAGSAAPDRDSLAVTRSEVRGLVLRADDFREICDEDAELAEVLLDTLGKLIARRGASSTPTGDTGQIAIDRRSRAETSELIEPPPPIAPPLPIRARRGDEEEPIPLVVKKMPSAEPTEDAAVPPPIVVISRTVTPPHFVTPPRGSPQVKPVVAVATPVPPRSLPSLPSLPRAMPPPAIPIPKPGSAPAAKPVAKPADKPAPDIVDLGSELRADLGGEHAVKNRQPSAPNLGPPPPPPADAARAEDDEPEIEAIVDADAPFANDADAEMTISVDADEPPQSEATASRADDGARVTETVTDTSSQTLTVTVEEPNESRPITADDGAVASGTISVPGESKRSKRMSEGWGDE
ncbi:MAG: protein phosphatase 2C domain-containing protein [Deltaproteobacteria bacterium]|nr:protein phosphatase 2C domain-containing protein [Deltaproteobacteria bacterium]MDQ3298372.1 protein phosphatase 2C domain-containing protein [Myxococcota bacterium]